MTSKYNKWDKLLLIVSTMLIIMSIVVLCIGINTRYERAEIVRELNEKNAINNDTIEMMIERDRHYQEIIVDHLKSIECSLKVLSGNDFDK